jgi:hypothetical protein
MEEGSQGVDKLIAALIKAKRGFQPVRKTADNPYFKSKYAPLENIIGATDEALLENGLCVVQTVIDNDLVTTIYHESGQSISDKLPLRPVKNDPQALGSAITYNRRYGLGAMLGVASEPDDDGNAATQPPRRKAQSDAAEVAHERDLMQKAFTSVINEGIELVGKDEFHKRYERLIRAGKFVGDADDPTWQAIADIEGKREFWTQLRAMVDAIKNGRESAE